MKTLQQQLKRYTVVLATTAAFAFPASATLVTQTQILEENGQDFTFDFSGLGMSDGSSGTLTIATGIALASSNPDFGGIDLDETDEFFDLGFEGASLGSWTCNDSAAATFIPGSTGDIDCQFSLEVELDSAALLASLLDGMVSFSVNFSDAVTEFGEQEEIIVSLNYTDANGTQPVSAPATLGFIGLGLLVLPPNV